MVLAIKHQIRVRCTECRYSRSFGQALLTAQTVGTAHALKKNHTVAIIQGRKRLELIHEHSDQIALPIDF
jgi:hypothetical protein